MAPKLVGNDTAHTYDMTGDETPVIEIRMGTSQSTETMSVGVSNQINGLTQQQPG